jgi:hypothetical protein
VSCKEIPMKRSRRMAIFVGLTLLFFKRVHIDHNETFLDSEFAGPCVGWMVSF